MRKRLGGIMRKGRVMEMPVGEIMREGVGKRGLEVMRDEEGRIMRTGVGGIMRKKLCERGGGRWISCEGEGERIMKEGVGGTMREGVEEL